MKNKALHMETTGVPVEKTVTEIERCLVDLGVKSVWKDYASGEVVGVQFVLSVNGSDLGYKIPFRYLEIQKMAMRGETGSSRTAKPDQAKRVAARLALRWIQAQVTLVRVGMAKAHEVFLPYTLMADNRTMFEVIEERGGPMRLLAGPESGRAS